MRLALRIVALVLCAIGVVWIGQGVGLIPGSFMTGARQWAVYGALVLAAGLVLAWATRNRAPRA